MTKHNYNFDVAKLNGPAVRLSGKFGDWQGEITVRDSGNDLTYSGTGALPYGVAELAKRIWRTEVLVNHTGVR